MEIKFSLTKKYVFIALAVLAVILAGVAVIKLVNGEDSWICESGQWIKHGNPLSSPTGECAVISTNSSTPIPSIIANENLSVSAPFSGQQVSLPINVKGEGRVFESVVSLRLKDKNSKILFEGMTMTDAPDMGQFGPFEKNIEFLFAKPADENVFLEVYWSSPKDGSDLDVISIPLKMDIKETSEVEVFFNNSKMDPEASCNKVFSVSRFISKSLSPARAALEALFNGPGWAEMDSGYFTSISAGVKINSLKIEEGIAMVDFNDELERDVGGSCKVAAIRAQISETLKQFSSVNQVIISINGRTEDILQP
jgi:hypothetical protein